MLHVSLRLGFVAVVLASAAGCSKSGSPEAKTPTEEAATSQSPTPEQAEASRQNVRTICEAALNYESSKHSFPPRLLKTKNGQPGLSWRVALLPNLDQQALYDQFKLDEAWDSPHNKPLLAKMPAIYQSPMAPVEPGATHYLAVATANSALADDQAVKLAQVTDGVSATILIVEANDAVPWTKPADYTPDSDQPLGGLGGLHPQGAFIMGMASSDVHFANSAMDPTTFAALCSRNGDDEIQGVNTWADPYPEPKSGQPTEQK